MAVIEFEGLLGGGVELDGAAATRTVHVECN